MLTCANKAINKMTYLTDAPPSWQEARKQASRQADDQTDPDRTHLSSPLSEPRDWHKRQLPKACHPASYGRSHTRTKAREEQLVPRDEGLHVREGCERRRREGGRGGEEGKEGGRDSGVSESFMHKGFAGRSIYSFVFYQLWLLLSLLFLILLLLLLLLILILLLLLLLLFFDTITLIIFIGLYYYCDCYYCCYWMGFSRREHSLSCN